MREFLDFQGWLESVSVSLVSAMDSVALFLPKLLFGSLVFGLGWLFARGIQALLRRLLERIGIDRVMRDSSAGEALRDAGVGAEPSLVLARIVFWAILSTFGLFALQALGIPAIEATLEKVVGVLPQVFVAVVIAIAGIPLGRLVRSFTTSAAAAASVGPAARLGAAAQAGVVLVVTVLALSQLGVDTGLLITVITTLVATLGFSMGLAFALGAKPIVAHILAGHFLRQNLQAGSNLEVLGKSGQVRSVGAVSTVLADGDREWLVPNERLLNEIHGR